MDRTLLEEKLNALLIDEMEIDAIKLHPEARLKEDIGIDSLDYVDIVVFINREFGFKINMEEMKAVQTLSDFYDYVENKITH